MRIRLAFIAALVALIAVGAGAQAASADDGSSSYGSVHLRSAHAPQPSRIVELSPSQTRGLRTSGGADDFHFAPPVTNFATAGPCRFPSACAFAGDNIGATLQASEPNNCVNSGGGSQGFNSTVWFRVNTGAIGGRMYVQVDHASAGLNPFFLIAPYNTSTTTPVFGSGTCDIGNPISHVYFDTFGIQGNIGMAVGSPDPPNTQGSYRVILSWDPDTDGDNVLDSSDRCDTQRGPASLRGCPDSDGDRIPDIDDACDHAQGPASLGGCPDSDGDGIRDISDACAFENSNARDANHNGCLDFARFDALDVSGFLWSSVRNRIRIDKFTIKGLPSGAKVTLKCSRRKICKKSSKKAGSKGKVSFKKLKRKRLPPGQKLSIKVTKAGYISRAISWKAKKKGTGLTKRSRCARPGGKFQRCSQVSVIR